MRPVVFVVLASAVLAAGPVRAESRLVFPRIVFQRGMFSGVAIANGGTVAAELSMQAYTSDGARLLGTATTRLAPGEQLAKLAAELLAAPASLTQAETPTRAWLEVTSPADGVVGFYLEGDDALERMDGCSLTGSGTDLALLLVEDASDRTTEIAAVNPASDGEARVDVDFVRADGSVVATRSATIAARGALAGRLAELFDVVLDGIATLRLRSDRAILCQAAVRRLREPSLVIAAAQSSATPARALTFAQLAEGGGWSTSIGVANISAGPVLLTLTAYRPDGSLVAAPTLAENPVTRTLDAGAILRSDLRSLFGFSGTALEVGWVRAEAGVEALAGHVEYGSGSNRALVPGLSSGSTRTLFPHQALGPPYFTGLAVLNPGSLAANLEVVSLDPSSKVLGKTQRVLRPREQVSLLVQQWVPAAAAATGGSVFVKSDLPTVATQLFGTDALSALANVPPEPLPTAFDPGAALPSIRVSPPVAIVEAGRTQKFTASGSAAPTWSVNGAPGGTPLVGRISPTGLYQAPSTVPDDSTVVVQAAAGGTDAAAGGATLDIVTRETLTSGLAQVTAVAYLQAAQRFFIAESQALAGAPERGAQATAAAAVVSEQTTSGVRTTLATLAGDTVAKIVPFIDAATVSHLLLAASVSGRVLRLNLTTRDLTTVASGLDHPTSLVLDPISGDLLVAEAGQVTVIPRARFDPGAASAPAGSDPLVSAPAARPRAIPVARPGGIAVSRCDGSVFVTAGDGTLRRFQGGREREVVRNLDAPRQVVVLHRRGLTCTEGTAVVVLEATRVSLVFPQARAVVPLAEGTDDALDLAFFPSSRPFVPAGGAALAVAEGRAGAGPGRITRIRLGTLYDDSPPQEITRTAAAQIPYRDPRDDTFETDATTGARLPVPDVVAVQATRLAGAVFLQLTFDRPLPTSMAGPRAKLSGFIDFDYQPGGETSHAEGYNPFSPRTGFGVDAAIDLARGQLFVGSQPGTSINLALHDNVLAVRLPAFLADLPQLRIAVVVGNGAEITDVVPNYGTLKLAR